MTTQIKGLIEVIDVSQYSAADIDDLFRSVVVVRDDVPLPPKDLLTLTIPGGTVAPPRSF
mgnify:CR=1 FL=1